MPKHSHLDDLRAQEIGLQLLKGEMDVVLVCDICRDRVSKVMEMESENRQEKQASGGWKLDAGTARAQMEIAADFYKRYKEVISDPSPKNLSQAEFIHGAMRKLSQKEIVGD